MMADIHLVTSFEDMSSELYNRYIFPNVELCSKHVLGHNYKLLYYTPTSKTDNSIILIKCSCGEASAIFNDINHALLLFGDTYKELSILSISSNVYCKKCTSSLQAYYLLPCINCCVECQDSSDNEEE